jgi:hypothetical protein
VFWVWNILWLGLGAWGLGRADSEAFFRGRLVVKAKPAATVEGFKILESHIYTLAEVNFIIEHVFQRLTRDLLAIGAAFF